MPEETTKIKRLLNQCVDTLEKCKKANDDKKKVITAQDKQLNNLSKQVVALESANSGILNSKTFWFVVGTVTGGILFAVVNK